MKMLQLTTMLVLLPVAALADQQAADHCAAKLQAGPAAIYSATMAKIAPGSNIRDIVKSVTRGMVMSGDLGRNDAKPAAEAAGSCLRLLNQ